MKSGNPWFVGAILAAIVLLAFWALYWDPQTQALKEQQVRLTRLNAQVRQLRAMAASLPQLEAELERTTAVYRSYLDALAPQAVTHAEALLGFKRLADVLGLEFIAAQTLPEKGSSGLNAVVKLTRYQLTLRGQSRSAYDYLASIERAPMVLLVQAAEFRSNNEGTEAHFSVIVPQRKEEDDAIAAR